MTSTWLTIRGVPLAKVGDWPTYRGDGTLTRQHLADAVAASRDPDIRAALDGDPRGWLGHVDHPDAEQARQSEPSIGRAINLRLTDNGDTLVGDLVDLPEHVARMYPRRSVELQPNVTTASGTYTRVLSGFANLGRTRGAIRGLADLDALLDGRAVPTLAATGEAVLMAVPDDPGPEPNPDVGVLPAPSAGSTLPPDMADQPVNVPVPGPTIEEPASMADSTDAPGPETSEATTTPDAAVVEHIDRPDTQPDPEPEPEPVVEANGPETVTVSKAVWDDLQSTVGQLVSDKEQRLARETETEREMAIAAALRDGRIAPADRDSTAAMFAEHGNGAGLALLARLPKGRVPTAELGANAPDDQVNAAGGDLSHLTAEQASQLGYTTA